MSCENNVIYIYNVQNMNKLYYTNKTKHILKVQLHPSQIYKITNAPYEGITLTLDPSMR